MRRLTATVAALILLVGCNSPTPSFNLMSPYGGTRVPPPGTGSFARPDSYYQPSPKSGLSWQSESGQYASAKSSAAAPAQQTLAAAPKAGTTAGGSSGSVRLVSMNDAGLNPAAPTTQPANFLGSDSSSQIRIVEAPKAKTSASPTLKGMTVNDATTAVAPAVSQPQGSIQPQGSVQPQGGARDLSQYPQSATPAAPVRTVSPPTAPLPNSGSNSANWKTRDDQPPAMAVVGS
jgi:hypothetical protein